MSTHATLSTSALKAPIRIPRKSRKKRNVFADEYAEFVNNDKIIKFESIDETHRDIQSLKMKIILYFIKQNIINYRFHNLPNSS